MTRDELIEQMAIAAWDHGREMVEEHVCTWSTLVEGAKSGDDADEWTIIQATAEARATLSTLCASIQGLSDVIDGKAVIVPAEATEEMLQASRVARMNIEGGYGGTSPWEATLSASPYKGTK